jgi:hypothetical protein
MSIAAGTKVGTRYSRAIPAFAEPVELGVVIPIDDYKFLKAFESYTISNEESSTGYPASSDHPVSSDDFLVMNEDIDDYISYSYIADFDGNLIRNAVVGPSSYSGSKNIIQIRPAKKTISVLKKLTIDKDTQDGADTLRMDMARNDNVIVARRPTDWTERGEEYDLKVTDFTIRSPVLVGIAGHTNTMIGNFSSELFLLLPMTDQGSINPSLTYRFSFYYRASSANAVTLVPIVAYYTQNGASIKQIVYPAMEMTRDGSETSDFNYIQFAIPQPTAAVSQLIPENARRLQIILKFDVSTDTILEIAYPVLEHSFDASITYGHMFIPEAPSDISFKEIFSAKVKRSEIGTSLPFDNTKVFYSHIGRKLFDVNLSFSIIDAVYLYQLRQLEQLNKTGYSIALRTKHPDLPPVMIGDIRVSGKYPDWDYRSEDVTLEFSESK